jgi:hypothetical protein
VIFVSSFAAAELGSASSAAARAKAIRRVDMFDLRFV